MAARRSVARGRARPRRAPLRGPGVRFLAAASDARRGSRGRRGSRPARVVERRGAPRLRARAPGPVQGPTRIFFVSTLPLAATNKVDRRAVAKSCLTSLAGERTPASEVPASALEGALWALGAVLKRAVGQQDNFFLLGGDSLRGQELIAQVREVFGVDLPVVSLFDEAGTVSGMARMIEAARRTGSARRPRDRATAAIPRRSTPGPVARSPAQTRAWFLARFEPGDPAYNQPHAYRLEGPSMSPRCTRVFRRWPIATISCGRTTLRSATSRGRSFASARRSSSSGWTCPPCRTPRVSRRSWTRSLPRPGVRSISRRSCPSDSP